MQSLIKSKLPFFAVLTAASLAGLSGLFIKNMTLPPASLAWIRTTVPTIVLGAIFLYNGTKLFRQRWPTMILASFLNVGRMYFFFVAFINTSVANATVMLFSWPIFVTAMSAVVLKEKVTPRQLAFLLMALAGIVIIYAQDLSVGGRDFIGMSAALAAAFFYSVTVIIFKSTGSFYGRFEIIFYQNLVGSLFFLPFFLTDGVVPTGLDIVLTTSHALFLGVMAFSFFFYGLKRMKASRASSIAYVEIVIAISTSVLFLGEQPTLQMAIGALFILSATYGLSTLSSKTDESEVEHI